MKRALAGIMLVFAVTGAASQVITGSLSASHDSDSFDERKQTFGYAGAQGWGVSAGASQYASPGWSASGTSLSGTYTKESAQQQVDASVGVARVAQHDYLVGTLDYLQHLRAGTSWGLSVERDAVNSQLGLEKGLSYTALALVGDHAFTDRFNVGLSGGTTVFSNHNHRPLLRTRWNYSLNEQYGLNAFFKTRSYHNSNPYRPEYFSPDRLHEASLGLSVRLAVADNMVLNASLDAGRQWIDGSSQPIWSAVFGLASARGSKVQWRLGVEATNSSSLLAPQSAAYRYASAVAQVNIPW